MWLKKFMLGRRVVDSIERPLKLFCDNEPAILYAHNNKKTKALGFMLLKRKSRIRTLALRILVLRR
jgi:hypothetical protein